MWPATPTPSLSRMLFPHRPDTALTSSLTSRLHRLPRGALHREHNRVHGEETMCCRRSQIVRNSDAVEVGCSSRTSRDPQTGVPRVAPGDGRVFYLLPAPITEGNLPDILKPVYPRLYKPAVEGLVGQFDLAAAEPAQHGMCRGCQACRLRSFTNSGSGSASFHSWL